MTTQDVTDFTIVDHTRDPGFYRRFLDAGNALSDIVPAKLLILEGLRLAPGHRALDVGCGLGDDVFAMAERVPGGDVTGVDLSEGMIEEARRRAPPGLPVSVQVADARALPFADGAFDAVRTERLLMHVPDAPRAVAEMARVTRPGGRVTAFDFDWDTFVIDSPDRETTRAVVRSFSDHMKHGWIGRQLARLFAESGLTEVSVTSRLMRLPFPFFEMLVGGHLTRVVEAGAAPRSSLEAWSAGLAGAHAAGRFFAGITAFIVAGSRAAG
jgi:ubiquinone/menaquinone biosynthesis C-methylase UbiE